MELDLQLWWGISGGKSSVKMEWCYSGTATLLAKQAGLMSEIQGDGDSGAVRLEDIELPSSVEDRGCKWSTDLSRVMVPHGTLPYPAWVLPLRSTHSTRSMQGRAACAVCDRLRRPHM